MAPTPFAKANTVAHYTLAHRSQRDPLINFPEAGDRLLLPSSDSINNDSYDYHRHLRTIGTHPDAVFINPNSVLPTPSYNDHLISSLSKNSAFDQNSLPINLDPALAEVLNALDDDNYVENDTDDHFFDSIIKSGHNLTHPSSKSSNSSIDHSKKLAPPSISGSAFSMSSSAMFRNDALSTLDQQFEKIQEEYQDSDPEDNLSDHPSVNSNSTATPALKQDAFDHVLDDFLQNFQILGRKLTPVLDGKTPIEKLETIRSQLLSSEDSDDLERNSVKQSILNHLAKQVQSNHEIDQEFIKLVHDRSSLDQNWDCQSILSTYSNLENHPRLIRMRDALGLKSNHKDDQKSDTQIQIDRRSGLPIVNGKVIKANVTSTDDDSSSDSSTNTDLARSTIKRDRNESKEEKKLRKSNVKAERSARRQEKKTVKQVFNCETLKQKHKNHQQRQQVQIRKSTLLL